MDLSFFCDSGRRFEDILLNNAVCMQYSLGVKRDEMRKLEEVALAEERKLELAEQYLEEDAALFDEFLKENDRNASEAIKM
jgi:hypothetical protein